MATRKKSGDPRKVASASSFKKKSGGIFELPSGEVVRLKSAGGMRTFLAAGVVPNSLMVIIQESLDTGQTPDMSSVMGKDGEGMNETQIEEMMALIDNIVVQVLVEPACFHPIYDPIHDRAGEALDEVDRDEDTLYVDEIPDEDKLFMFQWATGGTSNLEQFRSELASGLGSVPRLTDMVNKA